MAITYAYQRPDNSLADFIFSFWKTHNDSDQRTQYTVLPDGGIELILSLCPDGTAKTTLCGLSTCAKEITIAGQAVLFGIRFKLLAVDSLLHTTLAADSLLEVPNDFWGFDVRADTPLSHVVDSVSLRLNRQIDSLSIDPRRHKLWQLIYTSTGALSVDELAMETGWSARQMNRYFSRTFGVPLKSYLEQLAFYATLPQIRQGTLSPLDHYYDQSHFIRQVKKHSGSTPKQLYQQRNTRFLQLGD